ncbi:chitinase-like protein PB1E7.04c isoform X4 [Mastomys coucha]|uniref:chitinase-like protein PB1E7.04c isoform X4 n=1 Tax=Mastomys coucha TaxID=35658 RepID=UPI0012625DFF|nr:chitinase-like protein PB1E7.04c isoform X4 [Mastomys coucha]
MNQKSSGLQSKETEAPSETQDPLKVTSSLLDDTQGQKTNTKTPMPIIHTRKLSSVDPSTSTPMTRRVSIQEPPASLFLPHRVSAPCSSSLSTILPRRLSTQETLSQGSQSNIQDIQSVAYNRWLSSRETSSLSHNHRLSILSSHTLSGALSEIHSSQSETEKHPSTTQSYILNRKQVRSSVDVPPSITQSPQASIRSFESFVWDSKESLEKELSDDSMSDHSTLDSSSKLSSISTIVNSNSTNLPLMDFSLFICSLLTGVNIILGVLFYLMQARKFLQEGVTYTLGSSFYLAWINVFFFFMIGLAGLWSLLLSELHQLLVYPVTPGLMVLRHDNEPTPMVCLLRLSTAYTPDNPPLYWSYVTSDFPQPRILIYILKKNIFCPEYFFIWLCMLNKAFHGTAIFPYPYLVHLCPPK